MNRTRLGLGIAIFVVALAAVTTSGLFFDVVPVRSRIIRKKTDPRFKLARETDFSTSTTATAARNPN